MSIGRSQYMHHFTAKTNPSPQRRQQYIRMRKTLRKIARPAQTCVFKKTVRYSNQSSRNENEQGPSAINNINCNTAMLFRRRRELEGVSALSRRRSLISTSAYVVCVYCTFCFALDVAIERLRLPSTQQPTTRVGRAAGFSEKSRRAKEALLAGILALPPFLGVRNAAGQPKA